MIDYLREALEELKRVDHLIYVSLKYTRTVDVLRNIVERVILFHDKLFDGILHKMEEREKITEIPDAPVKKARLIESLFSDDEKIVEEVKFYLMLRKLMRAKYDKFTEFRRHVTMRVHMESGETKDINIDVSHEYYNLIKDFFEHINKKEELQ